MLSVPTDSAEFFLWLASPAAQGAILALLLQRWAWFEAKDSKFKAWSTFLGSLLYPIPTTALAVWLGLIQITLPATPQEWVLLVANLMLQGFAVWAGSQFAHQNDPQMSLARLKKHG